MANYLNTTEFLPLVITANFTSTGDNLNLAEEDPLFWIIIPTINQNSASDCIWSKGQLKELIKKYVKTELKFTSKKLAWRYTKNNEITKARFLWSILYKVNDKICQLTNVSYLPNVRRIAQPNYLITSLLDTWN